MTGNELAAALQPKVAAMVEAARADERRTVAEAIAYRIRAELVCCDIYERLAPKRDDETFRSADYRGHDLCYWGEASARIAESYANGEEQRDDYHFPDGCICHIREDPDRGEVYTRPDGRLCPAHDCSCDIGLTCRVHEPAVP